MPILNYKCSECGKIFSKIFVDIQDAPKTCPVCDSSLITEQGNSFATDTSAFARLACSSCGTCDSCGGTEVDNCSRS